MGLRRILGAGLLILVLSLVAAGQANAAVVSAQTDAEGNSYGVSIFESDNPESNVITIRRLVEGGSQRIEVSDTGAELTTDDATNCTKVGSGTSAVVTCRLTLSSEEEAFAVVFAGEEDDRVTINTTGGPIAGELRGEGGNDTLQGGAGGDRLHGQERASSEPGNDVLRGGGGPDTLFGGQGDDTVDGQDGGDYVEEVDGGSGDKDVYRDTGTGASDADWLSYASVMSGVRITVGDGPDDGEDAGLEGDDVQAGFEILDGSPGHDSIAGGTAAEEIHGGAGNDDLTGGAGADLVRGEDGTDVLRMQDGQADLRTDCGKDPEPGQPNDPGDAQDDQAFLDAEGVDPAPLRCEQVTRPSGGGQGGGGDPPGGGSSQQAPPPQPRSLPALTSPPTISGSPLAGETLTCSPGTWTGDPTFSFAWFSPGGAEQQKLADGDRLLVTEAMEGQLVYCAVTATNEAGRVTPRTISVKVPRVHRMPKLVGRTINQAREMLADNYGAVDLGSERAQDRRGRGIDTIPCRLGGLKGDCEKAKLEPGEVYDVSPNPGTVLSVVGLGGPLPQVNLFYYDAAKDEPRPRAGSPRKYGDNCPLRGSYDDDRRDAWVDGFIGMDEVEARKEAARVECDVKVSAKKDRNQTSDPFVSDARIVGGGGRRKLQLRISRPPFAELRIVLFHKRLAGTGQPGQTHAPGLGEDGKLTTTRNSQPNDVCFLVMEAATGRPVDGVEFTVTDPSGTALRRPGSDLPIKSSPTRDGLVCQRAQIHEQGTYTFAFRYRGANGVDLEGNLRVKATDRDGKRFVTISGKELERDEGTWVLARQSTQARAAGVLEDLGAAFKRLIDPIAAALGGVATELQKAFEGERRVSAGFTVVAEKPGPKPGILAGDAVLNPSLEPPRIDRAGLLVAAGPGNLVGADGASLVGADGGSLVVLGGPGTDQASGERPAGSPSLAAGGGYVVGGTTALIGPDGASLVGADGASLVGADGASVISPNGGSLIGNSGNTLIARTGGNVIEIEGRFAITEGATNALPLTALVAAGAGNAMPAAPVISRDGAG